MAQLESRELQPTLSVFQQHPLKDIPLAENCWRYSPCSQGDFQGLGAQQSRSIHSLNLLFSLCVSLQTYCHFPWGGWGGGTEREYEYEYEYGIQWLFLRDQSHKVAPKFFCLETLKDTAASGPWSWTKQPRRKSENSLCLGQRAGAPPHCPSSYLCPPAIAYHPWNWPVSTPSNWALSSSFKVCQQLWGR